MTSAPLLTMNDGCEIPQLGLGVFEIPPEETEEPVRVALEAGYRLIDTAEGYGNEEPVGRAVAASGIPLEEVFLTSKLRNSEHGRDKTLRAFDATMKALGVDVLDLFLIHWPLPMFDQYVETWRAFEELQREGRVRSIGVSNFAINHLERLARETDVVPAVNQVELHPWYPQEELRAYHAEHGILTEAHTPIGRGRGLLEEQAVVDLAREIGRTPAQVVLRWHVQLGNVVIPRSRNPARIRENLDVFGFSLDQAELARIKAMHTGRRIGSDPEMMSTR